MEELEEAERGQESTVKVSQQEFLDQIESMHEDLLNAWNDNQRVQALKIAIQVRFTKEIFILKNLLFILFSFFFLVFKTSL